MLIEIEDELLDRIADCFRGSPEFEDMNEWTPDKWAEHIEAVLTGYVESWDELDE